MPTIKAPSLKSIRLFVDNPSLGDPTVPSAPIAIPISEQFSEVLSANGLTAGGVQVALGAETNLVFVNDVKDPNCEEFFNLGSLDQAAAEDPAAAPEISAPITFDATKAYVVLTGVSANGKLSGTGGSAGLSLGLDASADLSLATCTAFDRTTSINDAAVEVFNQFKTIFSVTDLGLLRANETLMLGFGGSLRLTLELAATSLADAVASGVLAALGRASPVTISAAPSATLKVIVEVTDGYRLYAQRGYASGDVLFSVRKTASRCLGVEGAVGIKAEFADAQVLLDALSAAFAAILGLPRQLVALALSDVGVDRLSANDQALVAKAVSLAKLGDPALPPWQNLKTALACAQERAEEVVPQKITASLAYTWRRLTSESDVARFRVTGSALAVFHTKILALDLSALIAAAKAGQPGIVFERFLGKRVNTVEIGYGFCFGLNEFTFLKSWDTRSSRYIWLSDYDGKVQVSFLGRRGYDSTWMGRGSGHSVELNASMPHFTAPPPRPADFEVGFNVAFTWKEQAFVSILNDVADHAVMLQALPFADVTEAGNFLSTSPALLGQTGCVTASILVPPQVAQSILGQLSGPDTDLLLAYAMARALPCGDFGRDFAARRNAESRMRAYAPIWGAFLANREMTLDTLGATAGTQLASVDANLARLEPDPQQLWGWSVRGIARNFGGTAELLEACDELRFGCRKLARRGDAGTDYHVFEDASKASDELWADHFGARVFASLLFLGATREPGVLSRVERKVLFTWTSDGLDHAYVYKVGETV